MAVQSQARLVRAPVGAWRVEGVSRNSMKLHYLLIRLWLGTAAFAFAQTITPPAGPRPGGPGRGPGGHPVVRALDTDKDGTLSAFELANATTALKALDT